MLTALHRFEHVLSSFRSLRPSATIEHDDGTLDCGLGAVGRAIAIQVPDDAAANRTERNQPERHLSRVVSRQGYLQVRNRGRVEVDRQGAKIEPYVVEAIRDIPKDEFSVLCRFSGADASMRRGTPAIGFSPGSCMPFPFQSACTTPLTVATARTGTEPEES